MIIVGTVVRFRVLFYDVRFRMLFYDVRFRVLFYDVRFRVLFYEVHFRVLFYDDYLFRLTVRQKNITLVSVSMFSSMLCDCD